MKKNKNSLVPRLRFKEFSGEWEEKKLSSLGKTVNGLSGKTATDFGQGSPFVTYRQVFNNSSINFDECEKVMIHENENQNELRLGDILLTTSSETPHEVGFASSIVSEPKEPTYLNSFCFVLRPNNLNELNPRFSQYLFHSSVYRKSVNALAQGSTRFNLSKKEFMKINLPTPSYQEQQKIANTLSSLDNLIESEQSKLEQLQEHKKGLMQNLFPQEGETMPKFRFKEFENDGEWEEKQLGKIASIVNAKVGDKDVTLFSIDADKGLVTQIEKFGRIIAGKSIPNYYFIQKGDFAYNKSATKAYPQGQISILETHEEGAVPNSIFTCFRFKDLILPNYAKYLFMNNMHGKWIADYIEVGARAHGALAINNKILLQLPIPFPVNPKEQQKIADTLSSLDQLISAQTERIELLQEHKKGLMQGMFPVMEYR